MEISVQNLCKSYGRREALKGVSFSLTPGIYGLLGPNGAGKSTLIGILTGNLKADSGDVFLNGEDIRKMGAAYRKIPQGTIGLFILFSFSYKNWLIKCT